MSRRTSDFVARGLLSIERLPPTSGARRSVGDRTGQAQTGLSSCELDHSQLTISRSTVTHRSYSRTLNCQKMLLRVSVVRPNVEVPPPLQPIRSSGRVPGLRPISRPGGTESPMIASITAGPIGETSGSDLTGPVTERETYQFASERHAGGLLILSEDRFLAKFFVVCDAYFFNLTAGIFD